MSGEGDLERTPISHPEKLLFPRDGISKGALAHYYEAVAPVMLPHLRDRPVTLERYPAGIEQKGFVQKDVVKGAPPWLVRIEVPTRAGSVHQPLISDLRALTWLVNQNCITPHVWTARHPRLHQPDLCLFDLDPSADDPVALRRAALLVRDTLAELGLRSWVKTSGSKGFHIVLPLDGAAAYDEVWTFALGVGALLVKRHPDALTQQFLKSERAGRLLVDTGRNGYGATFAAAYAVRPKPGAPVSAPCTWAEIERGEVEPQRFTLHDLAQRLDAVGDLWADLHASPVALERPLSQLRTLLDEGDWAQAEAAIKRKSKPRSRAP